MRVTLPFWGLKSVAGTAKNLLDATDPVHPIHAALVASLQCWGRSLCSSKVLPFAYNGLSVWLCPVAVLMVLQWKYPAVTYLGINAVNDGCRATAVRTVHTTPGEKVNQLFLYRQVARCDRYSVHLKQGFTGLYRRVSRLDQHSSLG